MEVQFGSHKKLAFQVFFYLFLFFYSIYGSIGGGVLMIDTKQSPFAFYSLNLAEDDVPTTAVRALFADADKDLWLGTGSYGLARKDYETGVLSFFSHISNISPARPHISAASTAPSTGFAAHA